uniref:RING-type domain-containing protein n=1 Tax=Oryza rufipogon TaxID=4529 RepID=A0A0E0Q0Z0_ORYRU
MGNVAIGVGRRRRRWPEVEERLTQPRRLLRQLSDVDSGRLRRLIRSGDLAPCFDAAEDDAGLDEDCPICFYFYPSLNRSKCCGKGICTECFLQLIPSKSSKVVQVTLIKLIASYILHLTTPWGPYTRNAAVLSAKPHPTQLSIEAIEPKGRRNWINK